MHDALLVPAVTQAVGEVHRSSVGEIDRFDTPNLLRNRTTQRPNSRADDTTDATGHIHYGSTYSMADQIAGVPLAERLCSRWCDGLSNGRRRGTSQPPTSATRCPEANHRKVLVRRLGEHPRVFATLPGV